MPQSWYFKSVVCRPFSYHYLLIHSSVGIGKPIYWLYRDREITSNLKPYVSQQLLKMIVAYVVTSYHLLMTWVLNTFAKTNFCRQLTSSWNVFHAWSVSRAHVNHSRQRVKLLNSSASYILIGSNYLLN